MLKFLIGLLMVILLTAMFVIPTLLVFLIIIALMEL
jgi:hypothetical protein